MWPREHIPSDVPVHNQYIPAANLTSHHWLDQINEWTVNQKMMLNEKKTKTLIFNFTEKYQFSTRIMLNDEIVETLENTRLLGTIISDDLRWELNTKNIVKKANARMELLRRIASFGVSLDDMKIINYLFVRSLLEQSATVTTLVISQDRLVNFPKPFLPVRLLINSPFK